MHIRGNISFFYCINLYTIDKVQKIQLNWIKLINYKKKDKTILIFFIL